VRPARPRAGRALASVAALVALAACDDGGSPPPLEGRCEGPPGLYVAGSCETLAEGVEPYAPSHALWSDGADKRRWVFLPAGAIIDTSDPDEWVFPVGTRFYKEFARDGLRLETRLLEKTGEDPGLSSWRMTTYVWDETQRTVREETRGVIDALGTAHDVPTRGECSTCHRGATDLVLGFGAVQLAHEGPGVTLATLVAEGRLSAPIAPETAQIPGDATTQAALGYLHGNCGGCHRGARAPGELRLRVAVGLARPEETDAYAALEHTVAYVGAPPAITAQIAPGNADTSLLVWRMTQRAAEVQMPPLGTEQIDDAGLTAVRAWIDALPTP
jgi:hypothetical protein